MYEELKAGFKSAKALEALERVNTAIEYYMSNNLSFNVALIGSYCEEHFDGPKTQSIRNNKELNEYIKFKFKEFKSKNGIGVKAVKDDSSIFSLIEDERIKSYFLIQQEKYKLLEDKYNNLKKVIASIQPVDVDKLISDNLSVSNPVDLVLNLKNSSELETSIKDDISNKLLSASINMDFDIEGLLSALNEGILKSSGIELVFVSRGDKSVVLNKTTGTIVFIF
jgi:hypothetical protein